MFEARERPTIVMLVGVDDVRELNGRTWMCTVIPLTGLGSDPRHYLTSVRAPRKTSRKFDRRRKNRHRTTGGARKGTIRQHSSRATLIDMGACFARTDTPAFAGIASRNLRLTIENWWHPLIRRP